MNMDSIFYLPLLSGTLAALVLAWCGLLLRLRSESLAALSYAQAGGLGMVAAPLLGWPTLPGTLLGAAAAALVKPWLARSADGLIVLLLATWGLSLLLVANLPSGEYIGRMLIDGQLYFTRLEHAIGLAIGLLVASVLLPGLSRRIQRELLFPSQPMSRMHSLLIEFILAGCLALAAASIGVMAAFALAFIPARIAFRFASRWSHAVMLALVLGLLAHLVAFFLALHFDQPYGPVLTLILLVAALASAPLAKNTKA